MLKVNDFITKMTLYSCQQVDEVLIGREMRPYLVLPWAIVFLSFPCRYLQSFSKLINMLALLVLKGEIVSISYSPTLVIYILCSPSRACGEGF